MSATVEIQLIAMVVSIACTVPGIFLVLRKMSMLSDAISHSILPGIVIGFFIVENLNSPLLIGFAALTGLLTVYMVEWLQRTRLVKEDTAIGLVFPALFSVGVLMIAQLANDVHLDIDAVLLGELAFTPFDRLHLFGTDVGPKSLWTMGIIAIINLIFLIVFYKELKVSTFDENLSTSLGFSSVFIHYGLMSMSSVTIVGAFDTVGSVLVVGFIIVPAATAYLLSTQLHKMIYISFIVAIISSFAGYWLAKFLDGSIAGSITTVMGIIFFLTLIFAPNAGWLSNKLRRRNQISEISLYTLLLHLNSHESKCELHIEHLQDHINWSASKAEKIVKQAKGLGLVQQVGTQLQLTSKGEEKILSVNYLN